MNMCFLIPLLVGLICAILGYLLGKLLSNKNGDLQSKLDESIANNENLNRQLSLLQNNSNKNDNITLLQAELDKCKSISSQLQIEIGELKSKNTGLGFTSSSIEKEIPFDADFAFSIFGDKIVKDDLKIVEGIGPKIEELYHNAGIKTWKELSQTPVEKSQAILDEAGSRYAIHNPSTWALQAKLAYEGKWKELKEYQDSLTAGRA